MAKLFGLEMPDNSSAQAAQRRLQAKQTQRVQADEADQAKEMGARRRLLAARQGGGSPTLFGAPAGVGATMGG